MKVAKVQSPTSIASLLGLTCILLFRRTSPEAARVLRRVGSAEVGVGGEFSRRLDFGAGRAC
jgi:hypothetical protein